MSLSVKRVSLIDQTSDLLKHAIAGAHWKEWLPGEREISRQLGISRTSYRLALQSLVAAGWVEQVQGKGTRILRPAAGKATPAGAEVGLVLPRPIGRLRPSVTLWIDELRARLAVSGHALRVFHGDRFYARHPAGVLRGLIRDHPAACWILVMSTRPAQEWFAENRVPCVIAGSVHGKTPLPFVDVDLQAVCRHAAGVLLAAGHRHIALLNRRLPGPDSNQRGAGDREGEAGFLEAASGSKAGARASVIYHDYTSAGVAQALRRLLAGPEPVTGLVVADSHCYLSTVSCLAERQLLIPKDVSVISRDHDPFLEYLRPLPARYVLNPEIYAHRVLTQVQRALRGGGRPAPTARIFPTFVHGESVGPPPKRAVR